MSRVTDALDLAESLGRLIAHAEDSGDEDRITYLRREAMHCIDRIEQWSSARMQERNLEIWHRRVERGKKRYRKERP